MKQRKPKKQPKPKSNLTIEEQRELNYLAKLKEIDRMQRENTEEPHTEKYERYQYLLRKKRGLSKEK